MNSKITLVILLGLFAWSKQDCTKTYTIKSGDTCNSISLGNKLDSNLLISLNPGINCRALQFGQNVCLTNGSVTNVPCALYYTRHADESCLKLVSSSGLPSISAFRMLNPYLDCSNLQYGQRFCIKFGTPTDPPCSGGTLITPTTSDTCNSIASKNNINLDRLFELNPNLDCLKLKSKVCVASSGSGTDSGNISDCTSYYHIVSGDNCLTIASKNDLNFNSFIAMNKPINCRGLQPGQRVCVKNPKVKNYQASNECTKYVDLADDTLTCENICTKYPPLNNEFLNYLNEGINCDALQYGQHVCVEF